MIYRVWGRGVTPGESSTLPVKASPLPQEVDRETKPVCLILALPLLRLIQKTPSMPVMRRMALRVCSRSRLVASKGLRAARKRTLVTVRLSGDVEPADMIACNDVGARLTPGQRGHCRRQILRPRSVRSRRNHRSAANLVSPPSALERGAASEIPLSATRYR